MGKFFQEARECLTLWVRQKAWFAVVPDKKPDPLEAHKSAASGVKPTPKSRGQDIIERGGEPLMPHAGDLDYLLGYWQDAGEAIAGGMALAPLTAAELISWQNGTQTPLDTCEFQILLDMSREYVAFLHTAEDSDCPPPYGEAVKPVDKADVSRRLGIALAAMAGPKRSPREQRSRVTDNRSSP